MHKLRTRVQYTYTRFYTLTMVTIVRKFKYAVSAPMAGRTEPSLRTYAKVQAATPSKVLEKFSDLSLKNGTKKDKKKFLSLTSTDKRQWRESIQRALASCKSRQHRRVIETGRKPKGRSAIQLARAQKFEMNFFVDHLDDSPVERQSGALGIAAAVTAGVAALATRRAAKGVARAADKSCDLLDALKAELLKMRERLAEMGGAFANMILACVVLWLLINHGASQALAGGILAFGTVHFPMLSGLFSRVAKQSCEVVHQDGLSSTIADVTTIMTTLWLPNNKGASVVAGEFMKRVSHFPRASEGLEKFVEKVVKVFEQFVNFILNRGDDDKFTFSRQESLYDLWRKKVAGMLKEFAAGTDMPIERLKAAREMVVEGHGFLQIMATQESKKDLLFWIEKLRLALQPHQGALTASTNVRPMPWCIMIAGPSGIGKSTMLRLVGACILLLSGECKASEVLSHMWQKGTTEYWNGYIGQKCLVMDDCFQVKPQQGDSDSEAMQMIRAIGNWSYPLNFADVESKGRFYLDTPLIIGTTNCRNIAAEWAPYITCPEALVRRFQGAYWAELTDAFKKENGTGLDYDMFTRAMEQVAEKLAAMASTGSAITPQDVLNALPLDAWTLRTHTFNSSEIRGEQVTLRSAIELAAREIRSRREANNREVGNLQDVLGILETALEAQSGVNVESNAEEPRGGFTERVPSESESEIEVIDKKLNDNGWRKGLSEAAGWVKGAILEINRLLWKATKLLPGSKNAVVSSFYGIAMRVLLFRFLITSVTGIVRVLWGVIQALMGMFGVKEPQPLVEDADYQSNAPPPKSDTLPLKKWHMPRVGDEESEAEAQVGLPPNEQVHKIVYANTLKVMVQQMNSLTGEYDEEHEPLGQFIGLGADVYLFPRHFLSSLSEINGMSKMHFTDVRDGTTCSMEVERFLNGHIIKRRTADIAAVAMGPTFPLKPKRRICHLFLTEKEIYNVLRSKRVGVRLDVCNMEKDKRTGKYAAQKITHVSDTVEAVDICVDGRRERGLVRYNAPTVKGDCGAPLSLCENRTYGARCVMGFHVAGRDSKLIRQGFSQIVSQEMAWFVFNAMRSWDEEATRDEATVMVLDDDEHASAARETGLVAGSMQYLGKLADPVSMGTKTSIKPTPLQEAQVFGPAPSAPAVLETVYRDGVRIIPMVRALEAYQTEVVDADPKELEPIVDLAMQKFTSATKDHCRDVLTFEEALQPPPGWALKPLNRKSSPGVKYRHYVSPSLPGKTWCLGPDGPIDFTRKGLEPIRRDVEDIIAKAKLGIRKFHLFGDFLKDELRTLKKVAEVATRAISSAPMDYTIAVRMYFGAFLAAMLSTYVANGMAPGINFYREWYMIAESLLHIGDKVFDGDFSRFDSSEQPWVHCAILRYINQWYAKSPDWKEEDDRVRAILWLDLIHSRHLSGTGNKLDTVVQWNKSLPSGHPLTTMVNSCYSLVTLTGCYVKATGDYVDMWKHVYIITFGDDNLVSVSDAVAEVFNQVTVAKFMKELFNLTYTSGRKDAELEPYTTIDKVTFLKRTFVIDDDKQGKLIDNVPNVGWVAPLALDSFLFEPYWYKNQRDMQGDLEQRIAHCLCELCLHPPEVWDEYFPKLQRWCDENGIELPFSNRFATRVHVKTRLELWF